MKKQIILLITVLFSATLSYSQPCPFTSLKVYLIDDGSETNIRARPNGKIVLKLNHEQDYYAVELLAIKKEWFKIKKIRSIEGNNIKIPGDIGWIHKSVIGAATRKDVKLLDAPINGKFVGTIEQETGVSIRDVCSDWVKIEYNGLIGWIASELLCGNPVTTCP
ncbi:SH3 domain-containing protein [Aureibaculum luteum]|uniref:hypothetical protein n=1 Tax=Aureibaculum luteum TaxID=1548456 RepID=UPI000E540E35|nr:hypothetical protein [Aureibaculum luteum]